MENLSRIVNKVPSIQKYHTVIITYLPESCAQFEALSFQIRLVGQIVVGPTEKSQFLQRIGMLSKPPKQTKHHLI